MLSGGERARLAFAILSQQAPNFLVLDEPTNHLDLPAREALEAAVRDYDGTLLFVSHDRYFINALATGVLELEGGALTRYAGNYDAYLEQKRGLAAAAPASRPAEKKSAGGAQYYRSKQQRSEEVKRKKRIAALEAAIERNDRDRAALEAQLADPAVACDYTAVQALTEQLAALAAAHERDFDEWAALAELEEE